MKKRTGLALAGGILEIIAGTYLLIYALWALSFYLQIPNGLQIYNWEMLIVFGILIFFGIMAIIGKTKKDLATYGILNLLYVGMLIYRAIQTNATNVIWVFSFEMILLVIASMFFFFSKKSEYEIVYEERLKEYKANEPQEHKKLKNILTYSSIGVIVLIGLSMLLKIVGLILVFIVIVGYFILTIIINKKNTTQYGLTANFVFSGLAIFIAFICSAFIPATFGYTSNTVYHNTTQHQTFTYLQNTYLFYNSNYEEYDILEGTTQTQYDEFNNENIVVVYYSYHGEKFTELPANAKKLTKRFIYNDADTNSTAIAYQFYDDELNKIRYYSETGVFYDELPTNKNVSDSANSTSTPQSNLEYIFVISGVGIILSLIIILCTKNAQLGIEVNKQLKEEERKKTYEKYQNKN